ncbi:hypothetical protein [Paenibacillus sp. XY044]|uniref:hypothetical protein n=1 Tax=Paenibacillus sp. XY044 TaxID=2026089 RepID=UPI000B983F9D|nr:hypothetical protein [Paenibacillus sp. XY044]OZB98824.1 hypothetical protein CJP46_06725 [Paenibacillus sp. XY044]
MIRSIFRAVWNGEGSPRSFFRARERELSLAEAMNRLQVDNLSLFADREQLFLYYECLSEPVPPECLLIETGQRLAEWPGGAPGRRWVPMTDIFHYQRPVSNPQWARAHHDRTPYGRMALLRPEQMARYVYYHYQYQEEKPGDGDKYGIIGMHENLLFFYSELPETLTPPPYEGRLKTMLKPENWAEVMEPHFIKWEAAPEGQDIWRKLMLVLELRSPSERRGAQHA